MAGVNHPAFPVSGPDPLNILVVNRCRTSQRLLRKIFDLAGYRLLFVEDCTAALDLLDEDIFDIAMMHVNVPTYEDIEAIKLFRFMACGHSSAPVVILTSDATENMKQQPFWREWAQIGFNMAEQTQTNLVIRLHCGILSSLADS